MKIFFHPYRLDPFLSPNAVSTGSREGALLKIQWSGGKTGYADLHPWTEFGDEPLPVQLKLLKQLKLTPISEQSIGLAKRDAAARAENRNFWRPGVMVRNNALINDAREAGPGVLDEIVARGFTTVKLKCGRDLQTEAEMINRIAGRGDLFIRLDFNGVGSADRYRRFQALVHRESDPRIEYVEDPFPYEEEGWKEVRRRWKVAIDFELAKSPWSDGKRPMADILVLKPARMDVDTAIKKAVDWGMGITVTSSMDHPVGVIHAHAIAQDLKRDHEASALTAGCLTLSSYRVDAFVAAVPVQGPFIGRVEGSGIGFDELLAGLSWKPISDL